MIEMAVNMGMKNKRSKSAYSEDGPAISDETKIDEIVEPAPPPPPKPKSKIKKDN